MKAIKEQKVAFCQSLLKEMSEKGLTIEQVADVFAHIDNVVSAIRESNRMEEDEDYRKFHAEPLPRYRKWADWSLKDNGLDVTISDIENYIL